jgi:hypothetical protein
MGLGEKGQSRIAPRLDDFAIRGLTGNFLSGRLAQHRRTYFRQECMMLAILFLTCWSVEILAVLLKF